jgi:hypothetical protein
MVNSEDNHNHEGKPDGINIVGGEVAIQGDMVAGDKTVYNHILNFTVSREGDALAIIEGNAEKIEPFAQAKAPAKSQPMRKKRKKTSLTYKRHLLYLLELNGNPTHDSDVLSRWRFVHASAAEPAGTHPFARIAHGALGLGQKDENSFDSPPLSELANCSVEWEMRISDDGGDTSYWGGIRVRGFLDDIQFGYLVYMRSTGTVELYRARQILAGEGEMKVADTKEAWAHIRLDIYNSRIRVWVNRERKPHIDFTDTKFRDKGFVCLHTYSTHTEFRNLRIFQLVPASRRR